MSVDFCSIQLNLYAKLWCELKILVKTRYFCENRMPPAPTKSKMAIFSINVTVKVMRSLALVSFEMVSIAEYAWQI